MQTITQYILDNSRQNRKAADSYLSWTTLGRSRRAVKARTGRGEWEAAIPNPKPKFMEQVREVLRLRHYAIRTGQCYCDWIRRYVRFHGMKSREELYPGTEKVGLFLSDLAVNG